MVWLNVCLAQKHDAIHYTSLNKAIYLGHYNGTSKAGALKKHGDFGVGSESKLSSELVMLDGMMYSIPATGKLARMSSEVTIAFAAVKFFKAEKTVSFKKQLTLEQLQHLLDSLIGPNKFAAIRIDGKFSSIRFRSFVEQQKPYKPIDQAEEVFFAPSNFTGTLVGFFTPKSAEVINNPIYHFHVIDQARTTGGHLTDCITEEITISIDFATQLIIDLPTIQPDQDIDLNQEFKKN